MATCCRGNELQDRFISLHLMSVGSWTSYRLDLMLLCSRRELLQAGLALSHQRTQPWTTWHLAEFLAARVPEQMRLQVDEKVLEVLVSTAGIFLMWRLMLSIE